jgi:hypothetical protein
MALIDNIAAEQNKHVVNLIPLPRELLHKAVIMAIRLPDEAYLLPGLHIVTLYDETKLSDRAYSTHHVAYQPSWKGQDGPWVLAWGHYDKSREDAIHDMCVRAGYTNR